MTSKQEASGGCAGIVVLIGLIVFAVSSCGHDKDEASAPPVDYCPSHQVAVRSAQGDLSRVQADLAIARDAATATDPVAIRQYRAMIAADMGMLPHQAGGWRSVYLGRLATAERELPDAERRLGDAERRYNAVCGDGSTSTSHDNVDAAPPAAQ